MADAVTGNSFLDELLDHAPASASTPRRGQNYNYPQKLFLKPDGMVVSLQGDPVNRAYYRDKGYHELNDQPGRNGGLSEVDQYRKVEYPRIVKQQREKAALINAIRRTAERDSNLNLETTFDDYSVEEIREYLKQIKEETNKDIRVILPKRAQAREDARDAALLAGVETSETMSMEALQSKLQRGEGYDPLVEARRRPRTTGGQP